MRVMRLMRRAGLGAIVVAISFTASAPAWADAQQCSTQAEEGQQLRGQGRYVAARERFLACSAPACPTLIKTDCVRWASEILESMPTIVVDARDPSGKDLTKVRVISDGGVIATELDGRGIAIDPGPHKLRFEADGFAPITDEIVAKENVKGRPIAIKFGVAPAKPSSTSTTTDTRVDDTTNAREHTIWPWLVVGTGVVSAAVGVVFIATAPALPPGCEAATKECTLLPAETKQSQSYIDRRDSAGKHDYYPIYGGIMLVTGGVLIAGGLIWHFLEPTGPKTTARNGLRVSPFGVSGTF